MEKGLQRAVSNLPEDKFVRDIITQSMHAKIVVPDDYAAENAVKSAYLEIVSKDYFKKCTTESVINSVLDMVVQGLNPAKDQCYFVAFGNKLKLMRSYLGSIAVSKRFDSRVSQVNYAAIYGGDKFKIEVVKGIRFVRGHEQDFGDIRRDNIVGAYALALDADGNEISSDIMTFDDIKESWRRSQKRDDTRPILEDGSLNPKSDHAKQPDRFCCRTVVNRLCKALISVTDDKQLLRAIRETNEDIVNADIIDLDAYQPHEGEEKPVLDFDETIPEETPPPPDPVKMATKDQGDIIFEIAENLGETDYIIKDVSSFVGRNISKLRELTFIEAENYIQMKATSAATEPAPTEDTPPPPAESDDMPTEGPTWE